MALRQPIREPRWTLPRIHEQSGNRDSLDLAVRYFDDSQWFPRDATETEDDNRGLAVRLAQWSAATSPANVRSRQSRRIGEAKESPRAFE